MKARATCACWKSSGRRQGRACACGPRSGAREGDAASALRLKLYVLGEVLPLSASLPVFENLGLKVIAEDSFPVSFNRDGGWRQEAVILDFSMERADGAPVKLENMRSAPGRRPACGDGAARRKATISTSW